MAPMAKREAPSCYRRRVTTTRDPVRAPGRPPITSHAAIEEAAFTLFEDQGFESTTMDDIAAALGIGRRTLFRYYPSKNDIPWGQFNDSLRAFEDDFANTSDTLPVGIAIRDAIIAFNKLDAAAVLQHRRRMRLLLRTPALLAHSELRYAAWRDVVADFVARRRRELRGDLIPQLSGRVGLAIALSAYEQWLVREDAQLDELLAQCARGLAEMFD
jgi:TetR/AcrR family transcriptional regulator, regulator of mycofactocin system